MMLILKIKISIVEREEHDLVYLKYMLRMLIHSFEKGNDKEVDYIIDKIKFNPSRYVKKSSLFFILRDLMIEDFNLLPTMIIINSSKIKITKEYFEIMFYQNEKNVYKVLELVTTTKHILPIVNAISREESTSKTFKKILKIKNIKEVLINNKKEVESNLLNELLDLERTKEKINNFY